MFTRQSELIDALTKANRRAASRTTERLCVIDGREASRTTTEFETPQGALKLEGGAFRTSAFQLLDMMMATGTDDIYLSMKDFMDARGLRDRKTAVENVRRDLKTLQDAEIDLTSKSGKNVNLRVLEYGEVHYGKIKAGFTEEFSRLLTNKKYTRPMPIPSEMFKLKEQNPNAYYFMRKIAEHKNLNLKKSNADIICVKSLLSVTALNPNETDRQKRQRVKRAFERDMNALAPAIRWKYRDCKPHAFADFVNSKLEIRWSNYPKRG